MGGVAVTFSTWNCAVMIRCINCPSVACHIPPSFGKCGNRSRGSELVNCRHWRTPDLGLFLVLLNVHKCTATFSFSSSSGEVGTSPTWATDLWSCVILGQALATSPMPRHQGADLVLNPLRILESLVLDWS